MEELIKSQALNFEKEGNLDELYKLIKPYIEAEDVFALNLYSCFSLTSFNETDEEFTQRSIKLKTLASKGGIANASYRMGVNHLYGDDVEQSYKKASMFFERAIEQGDSYTKFIYGFSLYYGKDGNNRDENKGLSLMEEAATEGIEKAIKELEYIKNAKKCITKRQK